MTEETPTPEPPRCSVCRKKMPTEIDKQKVEIGKGVCVCDHNWLDRPIAERPGYVPPAPTEAEKSE